MECVSVKKARLVKESGSGGSNGAAVRCAELDADAVLLRDSSVELKKREAGKPLYLTRYE